LADSSTAPLPADREASDSRDSLLASAASSSASSAGLDAETPMGEAIPDISPLFPRDHVEDPSLGVMARPSPEAILLARRLNRERPKKEENAAAQAAANPAAIPGDSDQALARTGPDKTAGNALSPLSLPPALPAQGLAAPASTRLSSPEQAKREESASLPQDRPPAAPSSGERFPASVPPASGPEEESALLLAASPERAPEAGPAAPSGPEETAGVDSDPGSGSDPDTYPASDLLAGTNSESVPEQGFVASSGPAGTSGLAGKVTAITAQIESWRKAWQSGDLDAYMSFYSFAAVQGGRHGAKDIRRHKRQLWSKAAPAAIILDDVRVMVQGGTVAADMHQEYSDKSGKGDVGIKTLTFENTNGVWLITQEDWSPLPHEAGN
jgi:ketosteroid isomerase-like protein